MKKYLIPALALGLVMTSCQSDEPFAPGEGGEKQVTFTLNVPGELGTRAGAAGNESDKGGFSNDQGTLSYTLVLTANGDSQVLKAAGEDKEVVFTPPPGIPSRSEDKATFSHAVHVDEIVL